MIIWARLYEKTGRLKLAAAQWERSMTEYAHACRRTRTWRMWQKIEKKLETARVKLAA